MCLAVPGKIVAIHGGDDEPRSGRIDFHGSRMDASLLFTPQAQVDDWVLVHAGFAIRRLDEQEALETWAYLQEFDLTSLEDGAEAQGGESITDDGACG